MGKLRKLGIGFGIFIVIIFAFSVIGVITMDSTENELKNPKLTEEEIKQRSSQNISVQELLDNNSKYVGKVIHMEGKITQIFKEYGDTYTLNIRVFDQQEGNEDRILLRYATEKEPIVFTDISFYGTIKGTEERTALLTGQTLYFVNIDALLLEVTNSEPSIFD